MSLLIDLLRQHHQALEVEYSVKLSNDYQTSTTLADRRQLTWPLF